MLNSRLSEPFVLNCDSMKDDLDGLFGGDEEEIFRNLDMTRFDIDDLDLSIFESSYDSEDDSDGECLNSKFREIRNHDCMWGGQCCNKEFQRTQVPAAKPPPPPPPVPAVQKKSAPVLITHSSQNKVVTIQQCVPVKKCADRTDGVVVVRNNARTMQTKNEGRSLLLNRTTQPQQSPVKTPTPIKREFPTPQSSRPETPQSMIGSDDDFSPIPIDSHSTTSIFRSALDALTTAPSASWEDDLLTCRRTKSEQQPQPSQTDISRLSASAKSDHNYTSGKNLRLEGLGVDTPSDSEEDEEIDVVSLSERSSSSRSSSCSGLPTIPTPSDQETLEEITNSLLSASAAVSRKLKKTVTTHQTIGKHKRKKYRSESTDDDDDDYVETPAEYTKYHRQSKRQKSSPGAGRRKKPQGFSEEEVSDEKRYLHNSMERMRRIDLRICFEELKALVPAVASKDRAPKVEILKEAMNYCCDLGADSQSKHMQLQALRKEQLRLRSMVSSLRKAAAMACVKTPKRGYN